MEYTREQVLETGDGLLAEGRVTDAFELYDAVVAASPEDVAALLRAGTALLALDDLPAAWRYLEQAASLDPEDAGVAWLLGKVALAGGRGSLARRALQAALAAAPDDAELLLDGAAAAYYDLDVAAARDLAARALETDLENPEAQAWLGKLDSLTDPHTLLVDVGRAHCREGRLEEGLEHLMRSFEYGDSFDARLYAARAAADTGDGATARQLFEAAHDMDPAHPGLAEEYAEATGAVEGAPEAGPATARFCTHCGVAFAGAEKFCTHCGKPRRV